MAAYHDPCAMPNASPYFVAVPVLPDLVDVYPGTDYAFQARAVTIPVGGSANIDVQVLSDASLGGPYPVSFYVVDGGFLDATLDATLAVNGDVSHLISNVADKPMSGLTVVWLIAESPGGRRYWPVLVNVP